MIYNHNNRSTFSLPDNTMKISDNIYCVDDINNNIMVYYYISREYKQNTASNNTSISEGIIQSANEGPCCESIFPGAIWKTAESLELDTSNNQGLSTSFVINTFIQAVDKWQSITSFKLFTSIIFGPSSGITFNGRNQIGFGTISIPGAENAVAVTGVFFICSRRDPPIIGPCVLSSGIVETDMILNSAVYSFGDATLDSSVFDYFTTLLHEFGHCWGKGDLLPPRNCVNSIMWGFISRGQIKRTIDELCKQCMNIIGYPVSSATPRSIATINININLYMILILLISNILLPYFFSIK